MDEYNNNNQFNGENNQNADYSQQPYTPEYIPVQPIPVIQDEKKASGMAIAALVLGISSIVLACCYGGGILCAIPSIILAIVAGNKGDKSGVKIAGLITGIIGAIVSIIMIIYFISVISAIGSMDMNEMLKWANDYGSYYFNFIK